MKPVVSYVDGPNPHERGEAIVEWGRQVRSIPFAKVSVNLLGTSSLPPSRDVD